jgi:hypothetical protein
MSNQKYKVLVAGIVGDTAEVSTAFFGGLLRLQQKLAVTKDTSVVFEFFERVPAAIDHFKASDADRLILIDGLMGIDSDWILKQHPVDEVVPVYPLRQLNWSAVSTKRQEGVTDPDRLRRAAYTYNFTATSSDVKNQTYLDAKDVQAKIVSLSKQGCASFLDRYDPYTKSVPTSTVDVSVKTMNAGPFDFVGCVGTRLMARATS